MIERSYTRVTLSLDIIKKIAEGEFRGYHELGIIKHKIDLHDIISIEESSKMTLECDNPLVPCDNTNICWKAVEHLKAQYRIDKNVRIQLQKNIPVMGGLAGGSANAATVLAILNLLWGLGLTSDQLMIIGRKIGMDVPFYFSSDTAFDTEATGYLEPVSHQQKFTFVLAVPEFGVSTRDAYQGIDYQKIGKSVVKTNQLKIALRKNDRLKVFSLMHNDFEITVFTRYPRLLELKNQLLNAGCLAAMMTGSGSTVMGIAENLTQAKIIQSKIDCKTIVSSSLSH